MDLNGSPSTALHKSLKHFITTENYSRKAEQRKTVRKDFELPKFHF